ncbi:MAG TPA: hypothetical protein VK623_02230 [Flavobacterium sp.]|nr:hypothetical protein [Flavobacterium sp.]
MKKVFYSTLAFAFVLTTTSCSNDDSGSSNTTVAEVTTTITDGEWRITNFTEDGDSHTSDFTDYVFTFEDNNVIIADNGTTEYFGNWLVAESSDDNSSNDVDLDIGFNSPANFAELTEDWDVIERTSTKVRLKHTSGGDGSVDYLTFEKN